MKPYIETSLMAAIPFIIAWAGGMEFTQGPYLAIVTGASIFIALFSVFIHREMS